MPLPALSKTWQFNVNQPIAAQANARAQGQALMYLLKTTLTGFALNPWTVAGSSNGVTAGMDGVDRWTSSGALSWNTAGNAHSWIVLENPVTGWQLLIDLDWTGAFTESQIMQQVSPTGSFTGGTITNRPTAVDATNIGNNPPSGDGWGMSGIQAYRLHVWHSTDGECTRWTFWSNNTCYGLGMLERVKNPYMSGADPDNGWENPSVWLWWGRNGAGPPGAVAYGEVVIGTAPGRWWCYIRGQFCRANTAIEAGSNGPLAALLTVANEISAEWHLFPIGLWIPQEDTVFAFMNNSERRGYIGEFYDWWVGQQVLASLDTYPAAGTNEFVVFGGVTFPWNGSVPLTA